MGFLIENFMPEKIEHRMVDADVMRLSLKVCQADVVNGNKRRYPKAVLESAFRAIREAARSGKVLGLDHHPSKEETDISQTTHLIEDVEMRSNGEGWAALKVLPTTRGKNLQILISNGARLGVSMRGSGNVKRGSDGIDEVASDYKLQSIDFVTSPSFNVFASSAEVFESLRPEKNAITEAVYARFRAAKLSGWRGNDIEEFARLMEERH